MIVRMSINSNTKRTKMFVMKKNLILLISFLFLFSVKGIAQYIPVYVHPFLSQVTVSGYEPNGYIMVGSTNQTHNMTVGVIASVDSTSFLSMRVRAVMYSPESPSNFSEISNIINISKNGNNSGGSAFHTKTFPFTVPANSFGKAVKLQYSYMTGFVGSGTYSPWYDSEQVFFTDIMPSLELYSTLVGPSVLNPNGGLLPRYSISLSGPYAGTPHGIVLWNVEGAGLSVASITPNSVLFLHPPTSSFQSGKITGQFTVNGRTLTLTKNVTLGDIE